MNNSERIQGVCWITGLSCSGKTTLGNAIYKNLTNKMNNVILLDGDEVREAFSHDLNHTEQDRIIQIRRLQSVSRLLSNQGLFLIVAALYSNEELLNWNRENLINYYEIHLEASFGVLKKRDKLGLYKSESKEKVMDVVGVDIKWSPPTKSDMVINTSNNPDVNNLSERVVENIMSYLEDN